MCTDALVEIPASIWRQALVPATTDEGGRSPDLESAKAAIELEPVDELTVTTVVDNFFDANLADSAVAKRAGFGDVKRSRTPWMAEGANFDEPVAEHGFSALVTMNKSGHTHHVLFDAGTSPDGAVENMRKLDISPSSIEAIVLSHGHFDHTTGLDGIARTLGRPSQLPIVLHPEVFTRRRIAIKGKDPFELPTLSRFAVEGMGFTIAEQKQPSFILDGSLLITGEVDRTTAFETGFPVHQALRSGHWEPDPLILDDQAVIANIRGKGLMIITGCGHAGIVNITRYARRLTGVEKVYAVIGGFHLGGPIFEPIIPHVTQELAALEPAVIVPAHCTGWKATHALAAKMENAFIQNSVGTKFIFSSS
ncbi:MAG: MBL fold metallo-hydrolase [Actinobacteria bacterium]|nr:MBL fold metallo-hydrolase [Actinomycetota bacterium]